MAGEEVYALAIPEGEEAPLRSFVGKALRHQRIASQPGTTEDTQVLSYPFGMIFGGVSPEGVAELEDSVFCGPASEWEVSCYNQRVITSARQLLLAETGVPKGVDSLTFCLLRGLTHLLPSFRSFPRVPITLLGRPSQQRGILIVEDEECQRELFRLLLEFFGYSNLYLAQDGVEAVQILEGQSGLIELVLLNWEMPRMGGLEVMRHLVGHYHHPLGVILESGYPYNDYKREFFKLRSHSVIPIDYLVKPFPLKELELEIRVAMEYIGKRKRRPAG